MPASSRLNQAYVETAAINLGYTRIVSPVSGRVGLRQMDIGNIVQAGQTTGIRGGDGIVAHVGGLHRA